MPITVSMFFSRPGRCLWGLVLLAGLSLPATAQQTPYLAVIGDQGAPMRAAAGHRFYQVGSLEPGERVVIQDMLFDWGRIQADAGAQSFIHQRDVDRRGDGSVGVVNRDQCGVNAVSLDDPNPDPENSYIEHALLDQGDTVRIVGEVDDFYIIESPSDAYAFVEIEATREATPAERAEHEGQAPPAPRPTPTPEPVVEDAPSPQPVDATPETPVDTANIADLPIATIDDSDKDGPSGNDPFSPQGDSAALRAVEEEMLPAFLLPVEEQPLDDLEAAYTEVASDETLTDGDRQVVANRLAVIERNRELAATLARITTEQAVEFEPTPAPEPSTVVYSGDTPDTYDAIGRLLASSLYNGETLPRLYRLVEPSSQRTLAYVDPAEVPEAQQLLGQFVGLVGMQEYDASLRRQVFVADRIDILQASAE